MYRPEDILVPKNVDEVLSILAEHPDTARVMAGNTMIFEIASRGLAVDVKTLVDITQVGLGNVEEQKDGIHIGATVTLTELAQSKLLLGNPRHSVVAETAQEITPTQIRNVATVGGEICAGMPFFDLPTSLLALNAKVKLRKKNGQRELLLKDFILDFLTLALEPGELLTEVVVPRVDKASGAAFMKLGRTASDLALVNVAAAVQIDASGRCESANVWLGGVGSTFRECAETQKILAGSKLDQETVGKAAKAAADFEPASSIHGSSEYKKMVIPVLVRDCVQKAESKVRR
ncbi:MAG: FAD binding domain-containing protein [Thaumarchaeota archaeon]|nr:FAD binding domain-containing protein [Nitrososphaerota archaeon]